MAGREFRHANMFDINKFNKYVTRDSIEIMIDKDHSDKIFRSIKNSSECKFLKNIEDDHQYACGIEIEFNNNVFTIVLIRAPVPYERYDLTINTQIAEPMIAKHIEIKHSDMKHSREIKQPINQGEIKKIILVRLIKYMEMCSGIKL